MRTIVDHSVMFLLDKGEGEVVRTATGYGQVSGVTVHLRDEREPQVHVSVRRCRKNGEDDKRMGNNTHTGADLPDVDVWVQRAREAIQ